MLTTPTPLQIHPSQFVNVPSCVQTTEARKFAATAMNDRSSRSHTIYRLTLESKEIGGDMVKVSVLVSLPASCTIVLLNVVMQGNVRNAYVAVEVGNHRVGHLRHVHTIAVMYIECRFDLDLHVPTGCALVLMCIDETISGGCFDTL